MADEKPRKLTLEDPVDRETLDRMGELENARHQLGVQLLDIEQDRVRLLAAAHKIDEQQSRYYEQILLKRGLPGNTRVEVDANTGRITLMQAQKGPEKPESTTDGKEAQGNGTDSAEAPKAASA